MERRHRRARKALHAVRDRLRVQPGGVDDPTGFERLERFGAAGGDLPRIAVAARVEQRREERQHRPGAFGIAEKRGHEAVAVDDAGRGRPQRRDARQRRLHRSCLGLRQRHQVQNAAGARPRRDPVELRPILVAALWSPSTGIIDSHGFMTALLGDAERAGAMLALLTPLLDARRHGDAWQVATGGAEALELEASWIVNAAGLHAQSIAHRMQGFPSAAVPPLHLAKGNYFSLRGRSPFSRLIYPTPSDGGLGVHVTLDLAGRARFGPDVEWLADADPAMSTTPSTRPGPPRLTAKSATTGRICVTDALRRRTPVSARSFQAAAPGGRLSIVGPAGVADSARAAVRHRVAGADVVTRNRRGGSAARRRRRLSGRRRSAGRPGARRRTARATDRARLRRSPRSPRRAPWASRDRRSVPASAIIGRSLAPSPMAITWLGAMPSCGAAAQHVRFALPSRDPPRAGRPRARELAASTTSTLE